MAEDSSTSMESASADDLWNEEMRLLKDMQENMDQALLVMREQERMHKMMSGDHAQRIALAEQFLALSEQHIRLHEHFMNVHHTLLRRKLHDT